MAEDKTDLEARIRERSRRGGDCGVCEWLEGREDAEFWDRIMALPKREAAHRAIYEEIRHLGFTKAEGRVVIHRNSGHRRGPG